MKKVVSMLLVLALVFTMLPVVAFAAEGVTISFETNFTEDMTVGDTFTVTAVLSNNPGMGTMTFSLKWNESVVNFTGFQMNGRVLYSDVFDATLGYTTPVINQDLGIINAVDTIGYDLNGTLFVANFEIIGEGELGVGLKMDSASEFQLRNVEGTADISATLDLSDVEDLTVTATSQGGDEPDTIDSAYEIYYELSGSSFNGTGDTDEYTDYNAGDTVTATVYVTNKSGENVYLQACDLYLTYDSNLTYTGNTLTKGAAYDNAGVAYGAEGFSGTVSHIQAIGSNESAADISIALNSGATVALGTITFSISDDAVYNTQMPITLTTATNIGVGYQAVGDKTSYSPKNVGTVSGAEVMTTYTVTWKNDDNATLKTDTVGRNVVPTYTGDTPTKAATAQYTYTHSGWTPEIVKATQDATYTATYTSTVNKYTVTWRDWDDTVLKTEDVEYGATPNYTGDTPTRDEDEKYTYVFKAWDPTISAVTGDATYTATYNPTAKQFTITLDVNGGTLADGVSTSINYTADDSVTLPTATLAGKNFGGWKVTTNDGNWTAESYSGSVGTGMYGDVTLTAIWSSKDYTVSVDESITNGTVTAANADGASGNTANAGETINVTVKENAGYKIGTVSYYKTEDAADENKETTAINAVDGVYSFIMPAYDVTVTATFEKADLNINVDQNTENGTVAVTPDGKTTAKVEEEVTLTNSPAAGYELEKYTVTYNDGAENKTVEVTVDPTTGNGTFTMPAYEVTVTATFQKKALDINFATVQHGSASAQDADGKPITTAKLGETVTLVPAADTGYHLTGWTVTYNNGTEVVDVTVTGNSFTMPEYPVTVTAAFAATSYTITYMDGETEISGLTPATYTIESTDKLPTPTKANYTFKGWQAKEAVGNWATTLINPDTALNQNYGNVVLVAQWDEALTYAIDDYKYAQTGYKMLRIATNGNANAYTFDNAPMYYTTDSNYLVSGSNATGVFYTLISDTYVSNGKLNETGMEKLVAGTEAAKTIEYDSGDINGDGVTNIADANIVYQMIVNGGGYYTDLSADNRTDTESRLMADMHKESYESSVARATIADVNKIISIINGTTN